MIEFENIRFKNIGSYGNTFTELSLNSNKSTLFFGKNGNGKSLILDAICFSLYNKPFRKINKSQLVNSINKKELLVEIEFTTDNKKYKVCRGIKPNIFEIYENSVLLNQDAKSKDYQEYLENSILKITFKSFIQVVILGSARFSSFMDLSAADRRTVIEDLLDIQIFSTMNQVTKERLTSLKSDILAVKNNIELIKERLTIQKQNIEDKEKYSEDKIDHLNKEIEEYESSKQNLLSLISNLEKEISELNTSIIEKSKHESKREKLLEIKSKFNANLERINKDQSFFDTYETCPTCRQNISLDHKQGIILDSNEKKFTIQAGLDKLKDELDNNKILMSNINNIVSEIDDKSRSILKYKTESLGIDSYINKLSVEISNIKREEREIDKSKIKTLVTDLKKYTSEYESLLEDKKHYDYFSLLLKDGGVKTQIIKQYLPILNKYINNYLDAMNFFVNFNINENFEEVIKSRHRDEFSISNFSEGEKLRINLALLYAFKQLAKIKNSVNVNIQFFDEVLCGSMDDEGISIFMDMISDSDSNIFVISHRTDNIIDKFDRVFKVEKIKNFSKMKELK